MGRIIDGEIRRLVDEAGGRATRLLSEHRSELDAVAAALLERESLTGEQLAAVVVNASSSPTRTS